MTVAYAYFRYLIDRESYNSIIHYFAGPTDVKLIGDDNPSREDWDDMENPDKAQDIEPVGKNGSATSVEVNAEIETRKRYIPDLENMKNRNICELIAKIIYVTLIVLAILVCLGVIVMSMLTCIATKVYDTEQSHRLVGMVILAVTSAVAISMCIYAAVAVFKKQSKPIHATTVVLVILAIIQALILGVSVKVTQRDEVVLGQALSDSFKLAKEDNPRHVKLWTTTQSDLNCCGLYGPGDYHTPIQPYYFPPNVPISCCPTYDRDRSALVQERDREICKAKKTYYDVGCRSHIINIFKGTADVMLNVTIALIVIEIIIAFIGGCCVNKRNHVTKIEVKTED